jgi:hypothetical protein
MVISLHLIEPRIILLQDPSIAASKGIVVQSSLKVQTMISN